MSVLGGQMYSGVALAVSLVDDADTLSTLQQASTGVQPTVTGTQEDKNTTQTERQSNFETYFLVC